MPFDSQLNDIFQKLEEEHRLRKLFPVAEPSFCHNDYLGLSDHPEIREAGIKALRDVRSGSRGSRLLGGNDPIFERLESEIANFFGSPAALFFSSGYLANIAAVTALSAVCDKIVSDEKNHASLIDGIRLSGKEKHVFRHLTWNEFPTSTEEALFVTESVFSMDGDVIDPAATKSALSKGGFLFLDEAHAAGVFPENGKGFFGSLNLSWDQLAVSVTFGKAFGVGGAAILCSQKIKSLLINTARPFIFSTASPPVVGHMVNAAIAVMEKEGLMLRKKLWERSRFVRSRLGIEKPHWEGRSMIIPFLVPGGERAMQFSERLRQRGYEVRAVRYPTVSRGEERIRLSLSLAVKERVLEDLLSVWSDEWTAFLSQEQTPK